MSTIGYYICVPFAWVLRTFYELTGSYGWALVLFTIVVKLITLPFQMKSKKSMMRMNLFQPKIKEIQTKYANNPQKMNDEIQMLYAKDMQESRTPQAQMAKALGVKPDAVAGHSLGEFSALVVAGALSFEDGLRLVSKRAMAMQKACEATPSTMAAVLALPDEKVEEICASIEGEVVVCANYNCPGQIVISGSVPGIEKACELMKAAGAKRALPLKVGGAFHSPLMDPAKIELEAAINATEIHAPKCPVYQNVDALPHTDPAEIKKNLVAQLTASVRWTQSVKNMVADGATDFTECGPGAVLQGLIKKIDGTVSAHGIA